MQVGAKECAPGSNYYVTAMRKNKLEAEESGRQGKIWASQQGRI